MSCGYGFLTSSHHIITIDEVESENCVIPCDSRNSHGCCYLTYQQPSWNLANVQYGPSMCQVRETLHPMVTRHSSIICPFPPQCTSKSVTSCGCSIGVIPSHIFNVSITGITINLTCSHHSGILLYESDTSVNQSPSTQETKGQHTQEPTPKRETACTCSAAKRTQPAIHSKTAAKEEIYVPHPSRETNPQKVQKQVTPRSTHFNQFECKRDCQGPLCNSVLSPAQKQRGSRPVIPVQKSAQKQQQDQARRKPSNPNDSRPPIVSKERRQPLETRTIPNGPQNGKKQVIRDSVRTMKSHRPEIYDIGSDDSETPDRRHTSYHRPTDKKAARTLTFEDSTSGSEAKPAEVPPERKLYQRRPDLHSAREKFQKNNSNKDAYPSIPLDIGPQSEPPKTAPIPNGPQDGQKQVIRDSLGTMKSQRPKMYDHFSDITSNDSYSIYDSPNQIHISYHKDPTNERLSQTLALRDSTSRSEAIPVKVTTERITRPRRSDLHSPRNTFVRWSSTRGESSTTPGDIRRPINATSEENQNTQNDSKQQSSSRSNGTNQRSMTDDTDNTDILKEPLTSHAHDEQTQARVSSHPSQLEGSGRGGKSKSYENKSGGAQPNLNQGPKAPEKTTAPFHAPFPHSSPASRQRTTGHGGTLTPYLNRTLNGSTLGQWGEVDGQLDLEHSPESPREKTKEQDILNQQATINDLDTSGLSEYTQESEISFDMQSLDLETPTTSDVLQGITTTPSAKDYTKSTSHVPRRLS